MAKYRRESEESKDKEDWRRIRQLATWLINISGKSVKRDIRPEQLLKFAEEKKEIDLEKRQKQALKTWAKHKRRLLKTTGGKEIKPTKEKADEAWRLLTGPSIPKKEDK